MSTILNALRKAQSEQKVPDTTNASSSATEPLISQRPKSAVTTSNRRAILIAGSGAVILLLLAWFLYGPASKPQVAANKAPVTASSPATSAPISLAPVEQTQQVVDAEQAAGEEPPVVIAEEEPPAVVAAEPVKKPDVFKGEAVDEAKLKQAAKIREEAQQPKPPAREERQAIPGTPDGITLSGIAWQPVSNLRRAVVNDTLVGEGAVLNGARVAEIRPTSVRFEKGSTLYEASLPR